MAASLLDSPARRGFVTALLAWFRHAGRHDQPWRNTRDPYAILVSEFMLQQTTVAAVDAYFRRFLKRFPTVHVLAGGDLSDVLALWSGLGYYARARNLWAAARAVMEEHGGRVPASVDQLARLPGVGSYTAGAVSSLAFNRPAAALDANIIRVLTRVLGIDDDPKSKPVRVLLESVGLALSAEAASRRDGRSAFGGPRAMTLALMDLGAGVCLPRAPACATCPVSTHCLAFRFNRADEIPLRPEKFERPTVRRLVAVVAGDDRWLIGRRPEEGLFGGLWEFPGVDAPASAEPVPFLEAFLLRETGIRATVDRALSVFEHQLTHRRLVVRPYVFSVRSRPRVPARGASYTAFRWVRLGDLARLGISSGTKRIAGML